MSEHFDHDAVRNELAGIESTVSACEAYGISYPSGFTRRLLVLAEQLLGELREDALEIQKLRQHLAANGKERDAAEDKLRMLRDYDRDLFDPDERADDWVYESYGSNGRHLRESYLEIIGHK